MGFLRRFVLWTACRLFFFGLSLCALPALAAAADPRDSVILESKCIASNLTGNPAFVLKVYITNKDSLSFFTLCSKETTVAGTAYVLFVNGPGVTGRTFANLVNPLTNTLKYFAATAFASYNDASPDRFIIAAGFDPADPATIEPPNATRKAVWELKFKHSSDSVGLVVFDTARISGLQTVFTNTGPTDFPVNFVKCTLDISQGYAVKPVEPSNGSASFDLTPLFSWRLCSVPPQLLPASYRVILSFDPSFLAPDSSPAVLDTSYTFPSSLIFAHTYFWKVLAILNNGDTLVSEIFSFTVLPTLELISPTNGNIEITQSPQFVWHDYFDSASNSDLTYQVFWDDNSQFASSDSSPVMAETSWTISSFLSYGQTYYWYIKAFNDTGGVFFSRETRNFRIDTPPSIPVDLYPDSGSIVNFDNYLVWLQSEDPDINDSLLYHLQIDDEFSFTNPEVNASDLTGETNIAASEGFSANLRNNAVAKKLRDLPGYTNLQDESTYFWRVQSVDNHGLGSGYSGNIRSFVLNITNTVPNPVPGGFSPAGDPIVTTNHPNMSWFTATDPDSEDTPATLHYDIRLDTDGEFAANSRFQYATLPGNTSFTIPDSLEENEHWYWIVRTVDSKGGRSAFSPIQRFWVNGHNETPLAFSLLVPANHSKLFSKTPTLDWEETDDPDPSDSAGFTVTIANDSNFQFSFSSGILFFSSYTVGAGLLNRGQQYFWKVWAIDNNSDSTLSNEVFRFRVLQLGDLNGDGTLSPADVVLLLNHVFLAALADPPEVADMNCDGNRSPADLVLGLNAVFLGQPPFCDP